MTSVDIGAPTLAGYSEITTNGCKIVAGGLDIGTTSDQCHFIYRQITGDFDVRTRVLGIEGGDLWAKAGIMARLNLEPTSPSVSALTTPSLLGCVKIVRPLDGITATVTESVPCGYPHLWLRLQRTNGLVQAYTGVDGISWIPMGNPSEVFDHTVLLGLTASSHKTNQLATVFFSEFGDVEKPILANLSIKSELPGPTSRRTGLAITEIMYHGPGETGADLEFIELFNSNPFFEDVGEFQLAGDIQFTFAKGTIIPGGGYLVVARSPSSMTAKYGLPKVLGPFNGELKSSGNIKLLNQWGSVLLQISYSNKHPWPMAADETGHSLVLARPSYGESNAKAYEASYAKGGSPGQPDSPRCGAWNSIVINEYASGFDNVQDGFIELFNLGHNSVDISGGYLSDDPRTNKFRISVGTVLAPRSAIAFRSQQLGINLKPVGTSIYFLSSDGDRVVDVKFFGVHSPKQSLGFYPEGSGNIHVLSAPTPGMVNQQPEIPSVVINELMYHPLSGDDNLQYVELFNPGNQSVNLAGWRFEDGIDYTFPSGAALAPSAFLVVAKDVVRLINAYPHLHNMNVYGNYQGKLSHSGERVALARPTAITSAQNTNANAYALVDEVTYGTGGRWGNWSDGRGSSLELIDHRGNRRMGSNWADSDETQKAGWTLVESKGILDNGYGSIDSLHVLLMGAGECLVDDVEVRVTGVGTNHISNPNFEKGMVNWSVLGDHVRSYLETREGYQSAQSLHVIASNNGDTGANRIRAQLAGANVLQPGREVTIKARVRWLRGHPEILFRLKGNFMEAYGRMDTPNNLGTPGKANSVASLNAGPAITEVAHFPVLPAANQSVRITARIDDPDGVGFATLNYRIDPSTNYFSIPLVDNGSEGDEFAGDGIFSALIPGQMTGKMAVFYITATDRNANPVQSNFPADYSRSTCLIRFGEPVISSAFATYRMWMTEATVNTWRNRPVLSNEELDITFIYGNQRIVYNASARFTGSPWHQTSIDSPIGKLCSYTMSVPADDTVLGTSSFNKFHAPGNGPGDDGTIQCEETAYWMARQIGLPANYQRYMHLYVNGLKRGSLMEDNQVPNRDTIEEYFPDDPDGNLYKLNGWYEYSDGKTGALSFNLASWCTLNKYITADGTHKLARYRWNWAPRAANNSANEFDPIIALVEAANNSDRNSYEKNLAALADMEQWLRTFALQHVVGNWDSFGNRNAQNMFAYKTQNDRWKMLIWDFNIVLGNSGSDGPSNDNLFQFNGSDRGMGRIYNNPQFARSYLCEIKKIAEGTALNATEVAKIVDARYEAFKASRVNVSSPASIKAWINNRRTYIHNYLTNYNVPFVLLNNSTNAWETNRNFITLTGYAPIEVKTIKINGVAYPITWDTVAQWSIKAPLQSGVNQLIIRAYDGKNMPIPGATASQTIVSAAEDESPEKCLVISEIMCRPSIKNTEFLEIMNTSTRSLFDLSGYRIEGIDFQFSDGVLIGPGEIMVVVQDQAAFASSFGNGITVAGQFSGRLNDQGETIRLVRPGNPVIPDKIIDEATYGNEYPWPANDSGGSLQLLNPMVNHSMPQNWFSVTPDDIDPIKWRFVSVTGVASTNQQLLIYHSPYQEPRAYNDISGSWVGYIDVQGNHFDFDASFDRQNGQWSGLVNLGSSIPLSTITVSSNSVTLGYQSYLKFSGRIATNGMSITGTYTETGQGGSYSFPFVLNRAADPDVVEGGDVCIDDLSLVLGNTPELGTNLVKNGIFELSLTNHWAIAQNHAGSTVTNTAAHSGTNCLLLAAKSGGKDDQSAITQEIRGIIPGQTYTLSYWYLPSRKGNDLVVRLAESSIKSTQSIKPASTASPGKPNMIPSGTAGKLPLVITEIQPPMANGLSANQKAWLEIFNAGSSAISLAGCVLTCDSSLPPQWSFPENAIIQPQQYVLVWFEGTNQFAAGSSNQWHANLNIPGSGGVVTLSQYLNGSMATLDAVAYPQMQSGQSYGCLPDYRRTVLSQPTPGLPNSTQPTISQIWINEWMADNDRVVADPSDGKYKDWFELYNPGDKSVDLDGYRLADKLEFSTGFPVPAGYTIPSHGFLLVWADGRPALNQHSPNALHVDFKLEQDGETIALFNPAGIIVDAVAFGRQVPEVSQGRNASGDIITMSTPTPAQANSTPAVPAEIPIRIMDIIVTNGSVGISWASQNGISYQVQYKDSVKSQQWLNLGAPIRAQQSPLSVTFDTPPNSAQQRFYRVFRIRP